MTFTEGWKSPGDTGVFTSAIIPMVIVFDVIPMSFAGGSLAAEAAEVPNGVQILNSNPAARTIPINRLRR
jgi:hypothetical protein